MITRPFDQAAGNLGARPAVRSPDYRAWLLILAIACCETLGVAAVVRSYVVAQTTTGDEAEFLWFWGGMICAELPLIVLICCRATSAAARSALLIVIGFGSYLPKLLRNPGAPAYHDEYAHWRATYNIISSGRLFEPAQIIPIIARYPGLHAVTAVIVEITGLSIWQAATVLLVFYHIALLLGIMALTRAIGLNSRASALAAIIYGFNASFLYFDTQFSYESIAITLVTWALVAFVQAIRATQGPQRNAWSGLTAILSLGCVITHHLATIELTLVMALVSAALSMPRVATSEGWRRTAGTAWCLTAFAAISITLWIAFVAPGTISYLSPYLGTGISQLAHAAIGAGGSRQLFANSFTPWWEHAAAFGVTIIVLGMAVGAALMVRRRLRDGRLPSGRARALVLTCAALGMVYFPSTIFIFSSAGAEGARRTWVVSWIGLAVVAGPAATWLSDWAGQRRVRSRRFVARGSLAAAVVIALVGGTAAGLDASYRFPGPYQFGSDARSQTAELSAMTQWFDDRFGAGNHVVTDRYTGLLMASSGLQDLAQPSSGFPIWDLYTARPGQSLGPPFLIAGLKSADFRYLVVDKRMASDVPQVGVYFDGNEPSGFVLPDGQPIFKGRLTKFNRVRWMSKVFESDNYAVYRINLSATGTTYQQQAVKFRGKLRAGS